jgi:MFS family permease
VALSPSGPFVVLGMGLVGAASGTYYSPATALLTDVFDGTGRAIGVHRLGAQAVGFTGPLVAVVGARYGWRVVLLSALVSVAVFVGFRSVVRARPPTRPDTPLRGQLCSDHRIRLGSDLVERCRQNLFYLSRDT